MNRNEGNKSEGVSEQIGGKIKQGIGKLVGDEKMQAEGAAKEARGVAREETAKSNERVKGVVEKVAGAVKNRVGHVIDDEEMAAEGKVTEVTGERRVERNN